MTSTFVMLLDFLGTFAFAISGALVAVRHRLDLFGVLVLSFAAAAAGGITRDVLVAQVPAVLQRELYAVAALAGAIVLVAGRMADLPAAPAAIAGALTCFGLRWMAIRRGWRLPVAK